MIYNKELLGLLSQDFPVLADGTFQVAPRFFSQLYTFHIIKNGHSFPVAYFFLLDKKSDTYLNVIEIVISESILCGHNLNLTKTQGKTSIEKQLKQYK